MDVKKLRGHLYPICALLWAIAAIISAYVGNTGVAGMSLCLAAWSASLEMIQEL